MKKKKVTIITFMFLLITIICIYATKHKSMSINEVLKTNSYSYLPVAAKQYIQTVYEDTGEIILTEKNKIAKEPYLNPDYITYLSLTREEQKEYEVIPETMLVDYVYTNSKAMLDPQNIPESFDLRNVDGKNYTTPVKDQGGLGLCWSFATNAQLESLLLVQNDQTYTANAEIFSERQIDYATADDGITDSEPYYQYSRILGDGGTFKYATSVMIDGLGAVDTSWKEYDDTDYESMEKNQVYNFANSKYEVSGTVIYPSLNLSTLDLSIDSNVELRANYLNNLKSLIMQYGGSYISTADPTGKCSVSLNGSRFMYDDGICASAGHAMQVIGWDDNYEYSICSGTKNASGYYHINLNTSNCLDGTVITGKGAWILKNSWGDYAQYVYIAYDSKAMTFNLTRELTQKNWDNYYSSTNKIYSILGTSVTKSYTKKSKYKEQLNKIKFSTGTQDASYNIYIATDSSKTYQLYKTITTDFPGLYTVDLLSENIYLEEDFSIKITSSTGRVSTSFSVYTNNIDKTNQITTEDSIYENSLTNIDKYSLRIASETVNIPEFSNIEYKILDQSNQEITSNYEYNENIVFSNYVFSKILIDNDLPKGTYKLQTIYNNEVLSESNIIIEKDIITIEGNGTEDDPYIIRTPGQLGLIKCDGYAYYELANDIDLTYDTTDENGLFYNEGKGWEPIKYGNVSSRGETVYGSEGFSGGFNGNNHKIIGLTINRPNESVIGLFANVYNMNFANLYIKNIILEEPIITGYDFVGGVVGYANGTTYERILDISNISIQGGSINGNNYVGGIIGYLRAGSHLKNYYTGTERHFINSLYNSATIEASNYAGGLFGYVSNITGYKTGNSVFKITNILNKGTVTSANNAGGIIGNIKTKEDNYISIINAMNTGKVKGNACSAGIVCQLDSASVGELNLTNIYYIDNTGIDNSNTYININNVSTKTVDELIETNSYTGWTDFDNYWKLETINDIPRMPILQSIDFNYTQFTNTGDLAIGYTKSIYDYISPNTEATKNFSYDISNGEIISINNAGIITPLKEGEVTLSITSYYDGYKEDIKLNIVILEEITSNVYEVEQATRMIYLKSPTEVNDFVANLSINNLEVLKDGEAIDNSYVGTGMTIGGYTIILNGDVTGDGQIKVNDVMKISKYTVEGTGLEEDFYQQASDINQDGFIKVNDVMRISKYTVESGEL